MLSYAVDGIIICGGVSRELAEPSHQFKAKRFILRLRTGLCTLQLCKVSCVDLDGETGELLAIKVHVELPKCSPALFSQSPGQ